MINPNNVTKEKLKEHNLNWPKILDYPYRILIIGGTRSSKTKSLFNAISQQHDVHKVYLYAKDGYQAKY